jgi:hypothetical protein
MAGTGGAAGAGGVPMTGGFGGIYGAPYAGMGGTVAYETSCDNGLSEDYDLLIDCADPDCFDSSSCAAGGTAGTGGYPWVAGGSYAIPF